MFNFIKRLFTCHKPEKQPDVELIQTNEDDGYECAYLRNQGTSSVECEVHFRYKPTVTLRLGATAHVAYGYNTIDGVVTTIFHTGFEVKSESWDGTPFWEWFPYRNLLGAK